VFARDLSTGTLTRVDALPDGTVGNGQPRYGGGKVAIAADGSAVAFDSDATNLVDNDTNDQRDVFVRALG